MKQFVLLFRMDITTKDKQPSPDQMEIYIRQWMEWIQYIEDKGQLADGGNHFSKQGRVLKPKNSVVEGPYGSGSHSVAGYIIIMAKDLEDATIIAKQCPILNGEDTSVEIREVTSPEE